MFVDVGRYDSPVGTVNPKSVPARRHLLLNRKRVKSGSLADSSSDERLLDMCTHVKPVLHPPRSGDDMIENYDELNTPTEGFFSNLKALSTILDVCN